MNKKELADAVAASAGLTGASSAKAVDAVFDAITDALKKADDVRLVGFGTFSVAERGEKVGRNPRTGQEIKIAATKAVKFSAGAGLKEAVNG